MCIRKLLFGIAVILTVTGTTGVTAHAADTDQEIKTSVQDQTLVEETTETKDMTDTEQEETETEEPSYTEEDLKYLTCVIYSEAGNQSYEGKLAVANVVINRKNNTEEYMFGHVNTIKDVIYDTKWGVQFSVTIGGSDSMIAKALEMYESGRYPNEAEKEAMAESEEAAREALTGENNIGDYLFFRVYNQSTAKKYSDHVVIEDHIFYNT